MTQIHTSVNHTAARGALGVGASWLDSGITPGLVVVDSSRRGFNALAASVNPASHGGVANTLFAPAFTGC